MVHRGIGIEKITITISGMSKQGGDPQCVKLEKHNYKVNFNIGLAVVNSSDVIFFILMSFSMCILNLECTEIS